MPFDLATAQPVEPKKFDPGTAKPVEASEIPSTFERIKSGAADIVKGVGRQVGLTARAGLEGLYSIPGTVANAVAAPYNIVADTYDAARSPTPSELVTGKQKGFRFANQARFGEKLANVFGLPQAETPTERIAQDVTSGMAGAGGIVKTADAAANVASPIVRRIAETLAANRGAQIVAGATGPGAASVVREAGGGPVAQTAAGVAGSLAPSGPTLLAEGVRRALRGGEAGRQRVAQNIETFEDAGAGAPTVGQATESRGNRALESVLSRTPGGAGPVAAKAEAEAAGMGGKIDEMAAQLAPRTGAAPAGRQIKGGLEQFVEDFKGQSGKLYDELDKHIPKATPVEVGNTREALAKLNADIPGAPNLSRWFKNAKIQGIEGALKADTSGQAAAEQSMNPFQLGMLKQLPMSDAERASMFNAFNEGPLPYEALKKLRTLVGNEISDSTIASDVPRSKWRPLYAALTKDMSAAAQEAGPKAEAAFVRANNFHRAGMQRLDDVLGPILKKGDPEDVFRAALSGTQEGASTIAGVMKSLPTESRKAVAATMLQRLGKANPSKQNELGEVFSTESFLTNWNKLHPDAKRTLFSTLPDGMRSDLDRIAKVASDIRDGSKVFSNASGTAQAHTAGWTAGAFVLSLLTGNLHAAAGIAGVAGAANISAHAMTSPTVVRWLAKSTRVPVEQLPAQLNGLFRESLYLNGDERRQVRDFVKEVRSASKSAAQPSPGEGSVQQ